MWGFLHIINANTENQVGPDDASKFQGVVWIGLAIGIVCTLVFHIFVKEVNRFGGNDVRAAQLRSPISEILKKLTIYRVR